MTPAGWFGVWLLVGAAVVIVIEGAVMGWWSFRLGRRARAVAAMVQAQQGLVQADLERLRLLTEETRVLWRPYARLLRWLRHPLVVALIGSYRRRWSVRATR
jgi:hypothetical protein